MTTPMWDLVEEHFDDLVFLFGQWERALRAPDYTLDDLARRDEPRLLANIDGLLVAGASARDKLLLPALASGDASLIAPAALALLHGAEEASRCAVLDSLSGAEQTTRHAITRALQLYQGDELRDPLQNKSCEDDPLIRAAAIEALSYHGLRSRSPLWSIEADMPAELAVAALRAMRLDLPESHEPLVIRALAASDSRLRDEGLLTGVALDLKPAWKLCRELVRDRKDDAAIALLCLAIGGDELDEAALAAALESPNTAEATLWALGFGGRIHGARCALKYLDDPQLGGLASEAFVAIAGTPPAASTGDATSAKEEPPSLPPLEQEVSAADLTLEAEDQLVTLDAAATRKWFEKQDHEFDPKLRYLDGQPHSRAALIHTLRHGPLRRRHVHAFELMLRSAGQQRVHTRAFSGRQLTEIASLSRAEPGRG